MKKNINPKLYVRYVENIYAILIRMFIFNLFFNDINNQHPKIKFTVEDSESNLLGFLNTQLSVKDYEFQSCVFRKKINANVLLNNAKHLQMWLNFRCAKLCQDDTFFQGVLLKGRIKMKSGIFKNCRGRAIFVPSDDLCPQLF